MIKGIVSSGVRIMLALSFFLAVHTTAFAGETQRIHRVPLGTYPIAIPLSVPCSDLPSRIGRVLLPDC